jgi:hypothetical protein
MQKFNGIVKDISRTHAGKSGNVGTVVQRKDFMYYSECGTLSEGQFQQHPRLRTRSRFNKNADMKGSLYDSKNPPFLQLIHARDLPTSAWIQLENFTEDVDGSIDNRKTVTVPLTGRMWCTDPPAAMAPLKVVIRHRVYEPRRLPSPIKEYGKTAREIVIWVSDQFKPSSRTNSRRSGIKFISIFLDDVPSPTSAKYSPRTRSRHFGKIPQYIDADIRNILGTKIKH